MPSLSDDAVKILKNAERERMENGLPHDRYTLARLYDTYPNIVNSALHIENFEMGATTARKILRAEIEHDKARKRGEVLEVLEANATYKGTREINGSSKHMLKKWGIR